MGCLFFAYNRKVRKFIDPTAKARVQPINCLQVWSTRIQGLGIKGSTITPDLYYSNSCRVANTAAEAAFSPMGHPGLIDSLRRTANIRSSQTPRDTHKLIKLQGKRVSFLSEGFRIGDASRSETDL